MFLLLLRVYIYIYAAGSAVAAKGQIAVVMVKALFAYGTLAY